MEKLIFSILLCVFCFSHFSSAQNLEVIKVQKIDSNLRFNNHRYGGISGLTYSGGFLWGISDDRGQFGTTRLYKHSIENKKVKIENEIPVKAPAGSAVVDFESIYRLKAGEFLLSSEGDLNKKPRVAPFVKLWNEQSGWKAGISFPEGFLPEKTGMQTKGLQNNSAFEGLTMSEDEKYLYLMSEVPLYQNQKSEVEFLEYEHSDAQWTWKLKSRKAYLRDKAPEGVLEIMRGVSEILYWKKDHLLILERWVRLSPKKAIVIGAELFSVNTRSLKKKKLFTFDGELAANWEGLSWGENLSDGRKLLILVSDNNFEKLTPTQYLFLAFKEEKP